MTDLILPELPPLPQVEDSVEVRHVPGFPGYAVSDDGRVFSCRRRGPSGQIGPVWKEMRQSNGGGDKQYNIRYKIVILRRNRQKCTKPVHSLVLTAFIGPRPEGMQGCHNNGNRFDNHFTNLRWDTPIGNNSDKAKHGTLPLGANHFNAKYSDEEVMQIRQLWASGISQAKIGGIFNTTQACITDITRGKTWTHLPVILRPESVNQQIGKGENHSRAKLTAEQVKAIRLRHSQGEKACSLAREFDMYSSTISGIINLKYWKYV